MTKKEALPIVEDNRSNFKPLPWRTVMKGTIAEGQVCPYCGKWGYDVEDYCRHCGKKVIPLFIPAIEPDPCEEDEELDFVQEHKKLPIILEARTKGSWIEVGREEGALGIEYKRLRCPKCGWESSLPIPRNFCPECGLDMREGEQNG